MGCGWIIVVVLGQLGESSATSRISDLEGTIRQSYS